VKVWTEIPSFSAADLRSGTLRRSDLAAFDRVLEELREARVVLVTGSGTGAPAAAVGLAAAATAAGRRAALLECDLARPRLAAALGLAPGPGLHEYLRREAEAPQLLQALVPAGPGSWTASEPLVCIVAGAPSTEAAALLSSSDLVHATARLRNAYSLVVALAPPLGRDAETLVAAAAHADATIACVSNADEAMGQPVPLAGLVIQG
jgi:Mrp family chromosome partitioning ATPase